MAMNWDPNARALRHVFGVNRQNPRVDTHSKFHYAEAYQPLPPPTGVYPFRFQLEDVLGADSVAAIQAAGKLVFHTVGDTGNFSHGADAQNSVAEHLVCQREAAFGADCPAFFYHLGDVVYFNGEEKYYEPQFYDPYLNYTAPILAIAGNHDGNPIPGETSLKGFVDNFCASQPLHTWMAGHSNRTTMTQPNVYWTLKTPFATIIGLYSNVTGQLDKTDTTQLDWLTSELTAAKNDHCVIVAVHHPPYSLDSVHGGHPEIESALDQAFTKSGKVPTIVLAGHVHNYQRFTRDLTAQGGKVTPYVVAGAGGFSGYGYLHQLKRGATPPPGVTLAASNSHLPGFLRVSITATQLVGEYFTVPRPPNHLTGDAALVDTFAVALT